MLVQRRKRALKQTSQRKRIRVGKVTSENSPHGALSPARTRLPPAATASLNERINFSFRRQRCCARVNGETPTHLATPWHLRQAASIARTRQSPRCRPGRRRQRPRCRRTPASQGHGRSAGCAPDRRRRAVMKLMASLQHGLNWWIFGTERCAPWPGLCRSVAAMARHDDHAPP